MLIQIIKDSNQNPGREHGVVVRMNKNEALTLIASLVDQMLSGNHNAGRAEMQCGIESVADDEPMTGGIFTAAVIR